MPNYTEADIEWPEYFIILTKKIETMLIYDSPGKKDHYYETSTKAEDKSFEDAIKEKTMVMIEKIDELQQKLYAEKTRSLLIVFQGPDGSGKDSLTRRVLGPLNPQGVEVTCFKAPEPEDLAHDYLWRIHKRVPTKGQIGVFNRSHYEDVLVVRVKKFAPEKVWKKRYDHINNFENMLSDSGTTILKFFLHISKKEQLQRFEDRKNDPDKNWKYNPDDLEFQELWNNYRDAYQDVFEKCGTKFAPWYIIPADNKWYRDYCVAKTILKTLEDMNPKFPVKKFD
ncbi:MAG: polyphosphate kinase 2 family protein [Opitutaceae bacterium]|nr:polyphosphate kinase 2 family protein [Cytophagales bacterium]